MPPQVALALCGGLIVFLFWADRKYWTQGSMALWIPLVWLLIIGARPLTFWMGSGPSDAADGYLEGSPLDRAIFLGLIVCGVVVLASRRLRWAEIFDRNRWLCVFYLYLGLSVLWSDYPFVAFKRWIKDVGMVVVVLVILTDRNPAAAVRAVFAHLAYILIPLSVVLIKYFPDLGRAYNPWTGEVANSGAASDKNMLGMVLFASAFSLAWMWAHRRLLEARPGRWITLVPLLLMAPMVLWLFQMAHSATALVCSALSVTVLAALQWRFLRARAASLGAYAIGILLTLALLQVTFDIQSVMLGIVGRDATMSGRSAIWEAALSQDVNPVFGAGFYSFWLGDRNKSVSNSFHYLLGTAHNGYIEVYLNSGLIGVGLLLGTLLSAFNRSKRKVAAGSTLADLSIAVLVGVSVYAMTEATFNRLGLIWFLTLMAILDLRERNRSAPAPKGKRAEKTSRPTEGTAVPVPAPA